MCLRGEVDGMIGVVLNYLTYIVAHGTGARLSLSNCLLAELKNNIALTYNGMEPSLIKRITFTSPLPQPNQTP